MGKNKQDIPSLNMVLTVKSGLKFGVGFAIGAGIVKGVDKALAKRWKPTIDAFVEKVEFNVEAQKKA